MKGNTKGRKKSFRPFLKVLSDPGSKDEKRKEVTLKIGQTCGRLLLLDVGLDSKRRAMIISLRMAGAGINQHVVRRVLIVLVQSHPEKFGKYVNFGVT